MPTKNIKSTKKTAVKRTSSPAKVPTVTDDLKTAALVVSLAVNVAVLTGWLAIQITTQYDVQVAQFLFSR
jgi:hypothetical protein